MEGIALPCDSQPISTGVPLLDKLLPLGGVQRGSLVEHLSVDESSGAGVLALTAARAACEDGRTLIVCDRQCQFHAPAAAAWGLELSRTLILRPSDSGEELWAVDQALRCPGVGAVWFRCGPLDAHAFRRLQLAAELGGTLGLLVRPAKVQKQPTWASVQWLVMPQPAHQRWRLRVELTRCRGGTAGKSVLLEVDEQTGVWCESDHATHHVHPSAELADPTSARCQTRA